MANDLIHDRGRGPEIAGTRITVYNLLPEFLEPTATEAHICRLYELTPEQVAAARAYVLNNPDTVLSEHLRIEERIAAGNSPEVMERARRTHIAFVSFKEWLAQRNEAEETERPRENRESAQFPTFQEWLAERESRSMHGA